MAGAVAPHTGLYGEPCIRKHQVKIFDRGGRNPKDSLIDIASVSWGRVMDSISIADVVLSGRACDAQASKLQKIEPRRHEMVIYRGRERVWEGPITRTESYGNSFKISALDVLGYLQFTALSKDWPAPPIGPTLMVDRLEQIIRFELTNDYTMMTNDGPVLVKRWENLDPAINVLPFLEVGPGVTHTTAATEAFQKTVGEHMHDLGQSIGVNYTTVGRRIVIWDGELSSTRTLTEKDFTGDLGVIKDGSSMHTISHTASQQQEQGAPSLVGHAANDLSYYGPWEAIATIEDAGGNTTTDSGSSSAGSGSSSGASYASKISALNSQARRDLYGLYPVPAQLKTPDGSSFVLGETLSINDLVAGTNVPVRAVHNITPVSQLQRLRQLTVKEDPTNETVTGSLDAIGTVVA
jgi:hypothetical protein